MKLTLTADRKRNPLGARSVPVGFGRSVDVEPGDEFELLDAQLIGNPTFSETDLFDPADTEAEEALRALAETRAAQADPEPTAEAAGEDEDPGEDPVVAALREDAAARAEVEIPVLTDGTTEIAGAPAPAGDAVPDAIVEEVPAGDSAPAAEELPPATPSFAATTTTTAAAGPDAPADVTVVDAAAEKSSRRSR